MGTFRVSIQVGDLAGHRYEDLQALVDTGATYLVVPSPLLDSLGVKANERRPFETADGREVEFDLGLVSLRLDGRAYPALTVFGEPGSSALLGAVALEIFGLTVDPVHQRLTPVTGLVMAAS